MTAQDQKRKQIEDLNKKNEKVNKIKKGLFKAINPLNSIKMLNPMTTVNMIKKGVHKIEGMHHFDQAVSEEAQKKILEKAVPMMKDYLVKHGVEKILTNPVHLAGQVAAVKMDYQDNFNNKLKRNYITEADYKRFTATPDYHEQLQDFENEMERQKGFLGFDGEDGSDMQHFLPLLALAPVVKGIVKNKKVQAVVKKVGGKVVGAVSQKAHAKQVSKKLEAEGNKKTAQSEAISAGVPTEVVATHTRNLSPEDATIVSKDLKEVYEKASGKSDTIQSTEAGNAVQSHTLMYIGIAAVAALILFLVLKKS